MSRAQEIQQQRELSKETFQALVILGHNEADAHRLIEAAIAGGKKFKDTETMIQAIYQNNQVLKQNDLIQLVSKRITHFLQNPCTYFFVLQFY